MTCEYNEIILNNECYDYDYNYNYIEDCGEYRDYILLNSENQDFMVYDIEDLIETMNKLVI